MFNICALCWYNWLLYLATLVSANVLTDVIKIPQSVLYLFIVYLGTSQFKSFKYRYIHLPKYHKLAFISSDSQTKSENKNCIYSVHIHELLLKEIWWKFLWDLRKIGKQYLLRLSRMTLKKMWRKQVSFPIEVFWCAICGFQNVPIYIVQET